MTMRLAMNLLFWTEHFTEQHRPILNMLREIDYDSVEIPTTTGAVVNLFEQRFHLTHFISWTDLMDFPAQLDKYTRLSSLSELRTRSVSHVKVSKRKLILSANWLR
jgi:desulfoferrodoxin (superoxide reductase-like protein)